MRVVSGRIMYFYNCLDAGNWRVVLVTTHQDKGVFHLRCEIYQVFKKKTSMRIIFQI